MSESKSKADPSRRAFLAGATVAVAAVVVGGLKPRTARAAGGKLPHLTDADPLAKSLGYTPNHNKVDAAAHPTYKPGEHCSLCRFFQGTPGEKSGYAGCQIYPGYSVNAEGWCASFNPRS
ncbi:High potential iron-sulfur protein [mine drainage metagenome]|uniref:High potential iron-sulfur protein n=1 Tax=mine drainage metagenome TaxID=410659 RepID=T0ZEA7_9ZZZZ